MNSGHDQRPRALVGLDGRQYARKSPMYIDVLGLSSVTEAVHEASRMLRIGIMQAMAKGIDDDCTSIDNLDPQKNPPEATQNKISQTAEKDNLSVYSALTKRTRRAIPANSEASVQELNPQHSRASSSIAQRGGFAPRSWSATKKAGPSILSKRNRSATANGSSDGGAASVSPFQPGPKREKQPLSREATKGKTSQPTSKKQAGSSGSATGEGSGQQLGGSVAREDQIRNSDVGKSVIEKSASDAHSSVPSVSKASRPTLLNNVKVGTAIEDKTQTQTEVTNPELASLSSSTRKVGLPPSWCHVSAKSFNSDAATQPASALSLLRKSGTAKHIPLPAAPRGSGAVPLRHAGKPSLLTAKSEKSASENRGLIPLPSSTGLKVKYVPGSEIIDGVRPNGYTVSIDGLVKPLVTFNPKPKLPHKLRQTSVEKLFEAWRDNRKIAEGDALARALRSEQEMYAKATSRADYRAAVTVKLKEIRRAEN